MKSFNAETEALIIRDVSSEDLEGIKNVYNDKSVLKYLAKISFDDDAIWVRFKDMIIYRKLNLQLTSAIIEKKSGKLIGFTRVDFYPTLAYCRENGTEVKGILNELGPGGHIQSAYLISDYQNKGHMTQVMSLLKKHLAENNIKYFFGSINKDNVAAKKLLDKFNFKYQFIGPIDLNHYGIALTINKLNDEYFAFSETR